MADLGETCTRIAALLFAIDGTVQIRDSRTVTQEPAYWLLPTSLKNVSYSETRNIDFRAAKTIKKRFDQQCQMSKENPSPPTPAPKSKPEIPEPSVEELQHLFRNLASSGRKPALLSLVSEYSDAYVPKVQSAKYPKVLTELRDQKALSMNYKDLLDRCSQITIEVTKEEIMNVETSTRKQSEEKLWYEFRAGRVTASKMKAVCHTDFTNPSKSLIKSVCYPARNKFTTAATKWGTANELVAKTKLISVLNTNETHDNMQFEESGLHISLEHPYIAASPDGIVSCDCCGKGCIEIKCPFSLKDKPITEECEFLRIAEDGELHLDETHQYYYQVQTQMGVTKTEYCYFVVWTEKDIHIEQILFDVDFYNELCVKSLHFFQTAILAELVGKFYTRLPGSGILSQNDSQALSVRKSSQETLNMNSAQKQSPQNITDAEERWCYCDQVESGQMICCDNQNCKIVWFHFTCLKLPVNQRARNGTVLNVENCQSFLEKENLPSAHKI